MKAQGNKQYAPFTVTIDPAKTTAGLVAFYWRVVSKDAPPPPPAVDPKDAKKDDKKNPPKRPEFAYEDISFVPVMPGQTTPIRISRSITVPAGVYDVYVAVKEPTSTQKNAPPAEGLRHQTAVERAGFLEQRARHELGDRRPANRSVARAADASAADRAPVRARHRLKSSR